MGPRACEHGPAMSVSPAIAAIAVALPEQRVDRELALECMLRLFPSDDPRTIASLLERSGVQTRHVAPPLASIFAASDFTSRNAAWRRHALELSQRAIEAALA